MTGGAGTNPFTFTFLKAGETNTITDFAASSTNRLVFSNSAFNLGQSGAGAAPQLLKNTSTLFVENSTGSFSNASQRLVYDTANGQLLASTDGSSGVSHLVATLTGSPTVSITQLFFAT